MGARPRMVGSVRRDRGAPRVRTSRRAGEPPPCHLPDKRPANLAEVPAGRSGIRADPAANSLSTGLHPDRPGEAWSRRRPGRRNPNPSGTVHWTKPGLTLAPSALDRDCLNGLLEDHSGDLGQGGDCLHRRATDRALSPELTYFESLFADD